MPIIGYRLAGEECWRADCTDAGEDLIFTDGVREERISKPMCRRFVTTQGEIMYLANLDFPAVTKAEELATLEERICFDALNNSTQPTGEQTWLPYVAAGTLVVCLLMAIWLYGTSNSASASAASTAAMASQMQHLTTQVDLLSKTLVK